MQYFLNNYCVYKRTIFYKVPLKRYTVFRLHACYILMTSHLYLVFEKYIIFAHIKLSKYYNLVTMLS